jgi:hypothetical protein
MLMCNQITRHMPLSVYYAIEDKHYRGRHRPNLTLFCNPVLFTVVWVMYDTVEVKVNKCTCRKRKNSTSKTKEVYLTEERSMCSKFIAINVFSRRLPM